MGGVIIDGKAIWDGTHGGRLAIWKDNVRVIDGIIKKHGIKPVTSKISIKGEFSKLRTPIKWPKIAFPGIPVPHLHYNNRIYPVNQAQWQQFSTGVIKNIQSKLGKIKTVQPVDLAAISEMATRIR